MQQTGEQWRLGHRSALDGLRGVAIALVLASHVFEHRYLNAGPAGVTLFFALSGFLITSLLLEDQRLTGAISWRRFYQGRARRLLPALIVMLVAVSAIELDARIWPWAGAAAVLLYVANWADAAGAPMFLLAHTWSLAIEEQFYLVWPIVLAFSVRRRPVSLRLARWCLLGAAFSMVLRFLAPVFGAGEEYVYASTPTRADALLLGCALACALYAGWRPSERLVAAGPSVLIGVLLIGLWPGQSAHGFAVPTLAAVGAVPVLVWALREPPHLRGAIVRYLGSRSYGLYLWHVPAIYGSQWYMRSVGDVLWQRAIGCGVSLLVAELSWRFIERPLLGRRASMVPVDSSDEGHHARAMPPLWPGPLGQEHDDALGRGVAHP